MNLSGTESSFTLVGFLILSLVSGLAMNLVVSLLDKRLETQLGKRPRLTISLLLGLGLQRHTMPAYCSPPLLQNPVL